MAPSRRSSTAPKSSPAKAASPKEEDKPAEEKKDEGKKRTRNPATHPPYAEMCLTLSAAVCDLLDVHVALTTLAVAVAPTMVPPPISLTQEAIENEGDEKGAASRPTIKKYILKHYKVSDNNAFDSYIAAAIRRGSDNGTFYLPKGLGGKVRLAGDDDSSDEDEKPSRSRRTVAGAKKPAASSSRAKKPEPKKVQLTRPQKPKPRQTAASRAAGSGRDRSTVRRTAPKVEEKEKQSEGGRRGAARTNAKRGASTAGKAKTSTASKRAAAEKDVAKKPAAKKTVARKSVGAKMEAAKPAVKKPAGRKPPASRGRD
ncbi:hypothetical protein JCM10213_008066 [Rhodosporidiobolus nylandii]